MLKTETKKKIHTFINKVLDVNTSWVEMWNELGCCEAFGDPISMDNSINASIIAEECGVSIREAAIGIETHVMTRPWDKETILLNIDRVVEILLGVGGDIEDTASFVDDEEVKQALLKCYQAQNG